MTSISKIPSRLFVPAIGLIFCLAASNSYAGSCGKGSLVELKVGGWGSDALVVNLDRANGASAHPGTDFAGSYIRFAPNLSPARVEAIRSIALTALVSGRMVKILSSNGDCSNATEINILNDFAG